jgi:hypothetical protein
MFSEDIQGLLEVSNGVVGLFALRIEGPYNTTNQKKRETITNRLMQEKREDKETFLFVNLCFSNGVLRRPIERQGLVQVLTDLCEITI